MGNNTNSLEQNKKLLAIHKDCLSELQDELSIIKTGIKATLHREFVFDSDFISEVKKCSKILERYDTRIKASQSIIDELQKTIAEQERELKKEQMLENLDEEGQDNEDNE